MSASQAGKPLQQPTRLTPDLFAPRLAAPRLIAIASGKGGVGKTWLAATLSRALVQKGRSVLLFDGDLGLANVDIQLGLTPQFDISGVIAGVRGVRESAERYAPGGFSVLAGYSGSSAFASLDPDAVDRLVSLLCAETAFQDIILDLGAGLSPTVRRLAVAADTLLVVVTEEPTSLTDAYAVVKIAMADRPGMDIRIVINQASSQASATRTYNSVAKACETFLGQAPPLVGIIARDGCVPDAIRRQVLLQTRHPNARSAQEVERLATRL